MKTIRVYVGCALTYANEDFKQEIGVLKQYIKSMKGIILLDFKGLVDGTPGDVYEHDIHECIKEADLIITECSLPSTGLGWEMGTAVEKHQKYVLAVAKTNTVVTRLVIGAECAKNPRFSFRTYGSMANLLDICREAIKVVQDS